MTQGQVYKFHNKLRIMLALINCIITSVLILITTILSNSINNRTVALLDLMWGSLYLLDMLIHTWYHRYKIINIDFSDKHIVYRFKKYDLIVGIIDAFIITVIIYLIIYVGYSNIIPYCTLIMSCINFILGSFLLVTYLIISCTYKPLVENETQPIDNLIKHLKDNTDVPLAHATCSICLEHYTTDAQYIQLTCSHHFHESCVKEWLSINKKLTCPLCRTTQTIDILEIPT